MARSSLDIVATRVVASSCEIVELPKTMASNTRVSPFGRPGEYRLVAARDAIGWNLDDENERRRAEYAANYYMKQTCVQRGYQVLEAGMLDTINYFTRFKCNG